MAREACLKNCPLTKNQKKNIGIKKEICEGIATMAGPALLLFHSQIRLAFKGRIVEHLDMSPGVPGTVSSSQMTQKETKWSKIIRVNQIEAAGIAYILIDDDNLAMITQV